MPFYQAEQHLLPMHRKIQPSHDLQCLVRVEDDLVPMSTQSHWDALHSAPPVDDSEIPSVLSLSNKGSLGYICSNYDTFGANREEEEPEAEDR